MCLCSPASAKGGFLTPLPASPNHVHHRSSPGSDEWAPWQGPGARSGLWDWGDVQSASTSGFCYIF